MQIKTGLRKIFLAISVVASLPASITVRSSRKTSQALFHSLEELARLVDISYCVGSTGIQKPFSCLSRCHDFPGFELVSVRLILGMQKSCYLLTISPFLRPGTLDHFFRIPAATSPSPILHFQKESLLLSVAHTPLQILLLISRPIPPSSSLTPRAMEKTRFAPIQSERTS